MNLLYSINESCQDAYPLILEYIGPFDELDSIKALAIAYRGCPLGRQYLPSLFSVIKLSIDHNFSGTFSVSCKNIFKSHIREIEKLSPHIADLQLADLLTKIDSCIASNTNEGWITCKAMAREDIRIVALINKIQDTVQAIRFFSKMTGQVKQRPLQELFLNPPPGKARQTILQGSENGIGIAVQAFLQVDPKCRVDNLDLLTFSLDKKRKSLFDSVLTLYSSHTKKGLKRIAKSDDFPLKLYTYALTQEFSLMASALRGRWRANKDTDKIKQELMNLALQIYQSKGREELILLASHCDLTTRSRYLDMRKDVLLAVVQNIMGANPSAEGLQSAIALLTAPQLVEIQYDIYPDFTKWLSTTYGSLGLFLWAQTLPPPYALICITNFMYLEAQWMPEVDLLISAPCLHFYHALIHHQYDLLHTLLENPEARLWLESYVIRYFHLHGAAAFGQWILNIQDQMIATTALECFINQRFATRLEFSNTWAKYEIRGIILCTVHFESQAHIACYFIKKLQEYVGNVKTKEYFPELCTSLTMPIVEEHLYPNILFIMTHKLSCHTDVVIYQRIPQDHFYHYAKVHGHHELQTLPPLSEQELIAVTQAFGKVLLFAHHWQNHQQDQDPSVYREITCQWAKEEQFAHKDSCDSNFDMAIGLLQNKVLAELLKKLLASARTAPP